MTGFNVNEIGKHFEYMQGIHSLDTPASDDGSSALRDMLGLDDGHDTLDRMVLQK